MELKEINVGDYILARPILTRGKPTMISIIIVDSIQPGGVMSEGKHYSVKRYTFESTNMKRKRNND